MEKIWNFTSKKSIQVDSRLIQSGGNSIWQTNFLQLSRLINSRISIWLLQPDKHFPVLTVEQVFQSMDCSRSKFRTGLTNSLVNFDRLWKTFQPFLPGFVASSSSSSYSYQHVQMFGRKLWIFFLSIPIFSAVF